MPRPMKPQDARELLTTEQTRARAKIQVARIIQNVQAIHEDEFTDPVRARVRLDAAKLLLAKTLPDLSAADINANHNGSITVTINKL